MSEDKTPTELNRVTAEKGREEAEDLREEADHERGNAEEHRAVAESSRTEAEQFRVLADEARTLREQYREEMESVRQEREALRRFDKELRENHRHLRQSIPAYILQGNLLSLLTAPVIYSLLLPFVLLDLWVTLYQWVCFHIYGMPRVPRRRYLTVDRHKLAYLNGIEKVNCTFCSYANGVIAYVREVAARTEQYWCPIKHARAILSPHQRYHVFFDYGDAQRYRNNLSGQRRALRQPIHHAVGNRRKPGGHDHHGTR